MSRGGDERGAGEGRATRAGAVFDAFFFVAVTGLSAAIVIMATILPNARKAARTEREVAYAEARVDAVAREVERLRGDVNALRSDPWAIERALKRKAKEMRPDLFAPQPLPPSATADVAAGGQPPAAAPPN